MKKLILYFILLLTGVSVADAQTVLYPSIANGNSGNGRGPSPSAFYNTSQSLYRSAELSPVIVANTILAKIGFNILTASTAPVSGNIKIYLENSSDVTNNKNAKWSTAISTMTLVYDGPFTIPNAAGSYSITLSTPYKYTGEVFM